MEQSKEKKKRAWKFSEVTVEELKESWEEGADQGRERHVDTSERRPDTQLENKKS